MSGRHFVVLALLFAFVFLLTVPASAQGSGQRIGNCTVIDKPGSYELARNIKARLTDLKPVPDVAPSCIVITASFVTLDLNGQTITGPGWGSPLPETYGVLIHSNPDGEWPIATQIRNGSVAKFNFGIGIGGDGHAVEQVRLTGNWAGVLFGGNGIRVKEVIAISNSMGIYGWSGDGNSVEHCQVRSNNEIGILMRPQDQDGPGILGSRIVGNTVSGNGGYGIYAQCPSLILQNMSYNNGGGNIVTVPGPPDAPCTQSDNNPAP